MHRFRSLALCCAALAGPAAAQDLTVVSWGGAYEAAQHAAMVAPFAQETGTQVEMVRYDGTAGALARRGASEGWDVIDMLTDQARVACAKGLLLELDPQALLGAEALADFAPAAPSRCAVPQNVYARVMAYDERAFLGVKPTRIEDFFDVERFPGGRAVQKSPDGILEWALMAEGVPPAQIYGLLSTDRGLRLAFRKLDTIRDHIVWWRTTDEPAQMLEDGRATMAVGYNGRFFDAAELGGAPIDVVWDGQIVGVEVWAIAATTDAPDAARAFVAQASSPEAMARLAERIPYGPARVSAYARIGSNPKTGTPMRAYLPNAPQHGARALVRDAAWYANTEELRARRFQAWLNEAEE
ncbi:extracellular solute-binding protein [Sediminimonas qiaohouensis]|uniref:extracellular solute-binding protein n=1 Tax=Sediminimonas qiaohouensis TaxID=552061 RepID=UPI000425B59F|nr:extracellular solute-binding protein [Sediminimonas qiaohouensis]